MSFAIHHNALSRFSVALMGAALLTSGLFYGIQALIKPADLQTKFYQLRSTIGNKAPLTGSFGVDVIGIRLPLTADSRTIYCSFPFFFDHKAILADWKQPLSVSEPQNIYYLPVRYEDAAETVFRATILLRDTPVFASVEDTQRVHFAFAVEPNGTVDAESVAVLDTSDDAIAKKARRMLTHWTYQPTLQNGVPMRQDNMEVVFIIEPAAN